MASYHGTFSCGHEGIVNVVGPQKYRAWKIEQKFSGLCPECYKKELEEKRKKEREEAEKKAKEENLPELIGTPKQVAWAETLRRRILDKVKPSFEKRCELYGRRHRRDLQVFDQEEMIELTKMLKSKSDASFWIDVRYVLEEPGSIDELIKTLRAEKENE